MAGFRGGFGVRYRGTWAAGRQARRRESGDGTGTGLLAAHAWGKQSTRIAEAGTGLGSSEHFLGPVSTNSDLPMCGKCGAVSFCLPELKRAASLSSEAPTGRASSQVNNVNLDVSNF